MIDKMCHSRNKLTGRTVLYCVIIILALYCGYQLVKIHEIQSSMYTEEQVHEQPLDEMDNDAMTVDRIFVNQTTTKSQSKNKTNPEKFPVFQPYEEVEFPTVESSSPRIPHIMHQVYTNESVPDIFIYSMRTFIEKNPTWKYMFWTYASGRKLLVNRHPYLVSKFDRFGENDVKKADLIRFAVLYEYGGVYADLDVENLRPLNITTMKYACILPVEPFEHSSFTYNMSFVLSNAVLLCRPKHPFFRQLLLNVQLALPNGHPVIYTGPLYTTAIYMLYNDIDKFVSRNKTDFSTNSPYFYKGTRNEEDDDAVYVPNTQYFMDNVDPIRLNSNGELTDCEIRQARGCTEFEKRKAIRKNRKFTFMVHYWFHFWCRGVDFINSVQRVHIKYVIPESILYQG